MALVETNEKPSSRPGGRMSRQDLEWAESYLRYYAIAKNWPRLAEIADILRQAAAESAVRGRT